MAAICFQSPEGYWVLLISFEEHLSSLVGQNLSYSTGSIWLAGTCCLLLFASSYTPELAYLGVGAPTYTHLHDLHGTHTRIRLQSGTKESIHHRRLRLRRRRLRFWNNQLKAIPSTRRPISLKDSLSIDTFRPDKIPIRPLALRSPDPGSDIRPVSPVTSGTLPAKEPWNEHS